MPKREKTPDPSDDEPRFLIVNYPYPAHANLEERKDTIALARWLGCIISPQYLIALHHKPSARNMVIVEVERTRSREEWRRLLGAHCWNDILISPTQDEKGKVSRIYFSTYSTSRQVQKAGWKRIDFEDPWFLPGGITAKNKFAPYNESEWNRMKGTVTPMRIPYPLSVYCDLPTEDPTNDRFCRPLPVEHFPRGKNKPQEPSQLVVGSDKWVDTKIKPESARIQGKPANTQKFSKVTSTASTVEPLSERRGRTPMRSAVFGVSSVPFAPPGLPPPPGGSLPPGLMQRGITTNSSSSSDLDYLEIQTATALPIDDEYCEPDVVAEGLGSVLVTSVNHLLPNAVVDSLWNDPLKEEENVLLCSAHGRVCSKGICRQFSRQLKEQEKQKREDGTAGRGRRSRGGIPSSNRGRSRGDAGSRPVYREKRGARPRRGAEKNDGPEDGMAPDAGGFGIVELPGGGDSETKARGSKSIAAEQSNDWETSSMGPW